MLFSVVAAADTDFQIVLLRVFRVIFQQPISTAPCALNIVHIELEFVGGVCQIKHSPFWQGILDNNFACFPSRCHQLDAIHQSLVLDIVIVHFAIFCQVGIPAINRYLLFKDTGAINILR